MRAPWLLLGIGAAAAPWACGQDATPASDAPGDGGADAPSADAPLADGATPPPEDAARDSTPADGPTPPRDAGPCGQRGGMRGLTKRQLTVAGLARTYLVYLPQAPAPGTPIPLVYVFHGYTMSGQQMHDITQYAQIADKDGIAVVFPDGQGGPDSLGYPWNVENGGQVVCGAGQGASAPGDDFAFMDAMKADVALDQCVDDAHVFSAGFSMGAYFSHHVGCYRGDVRAIAPHSGGTLADLSACTTKHVPAIIFHGTSDGVIAEGCDDPAGTALAGFPASATLWAAKNGCQKTYTTIPTNGAGGGNGQCYLYDGCPADGQVEVCTFTGMIHCWAGGSTAGAGAASACPTYASATDLQWAFFKKYAW